MGASRACCMLQRRPSPPTFHSFTSYSEAQSSSLSQPDLPNRGQSHVGCQRQRFPLASRKHVLFDSPDKRPSRLDQDVPKVPKPCGTSGHFTEPETLGNISRTNTNGRVSR